MSDSQSRRVDGHLRRPLGDHMFFSVSKSVSHLAARLAFAVSILATGIGPSIALEQIANPPTANGPVFTIIDGSRKMQIDQARLGTLPQYRLITDSPWEQGRQEFEGVLFRDVLALMQLEDADAVMVRAIDNYSQRIPRKDWAEFPSLLALRSNGAFLTRRSQGPARLVYPVLDYPELNNPVHRNRWVWLIKSIEQVE